ncbi:DUF5667 domain-containing protein [Cytobacillus massiliigabonensis]|uniref:DUF5667 domain-containing protein n=1 Tax=Cytobacillus massiliigabonensis TaxID=1871011 RepID=UPI000C841C4D|nr:DUF5667 domain-containing protein [Cytobacillus massiliigabonensis]
MKFFSNKELQKLGRSSIALLLAGTFTFSTSLASAAESTELTGDYETVELPDNLNVPKENAEQANEEQIEEETPSLLPGSFFYFAKIALEKIKLAFTFNQEKEAKLLATFAAERLAEAEALFNEGKEEEALEAIKNAFESLENVESIIGEEESVGEDAADAEEKTETDDSIAVGSKTDGESEDVVAEEDADVDMLLSQNIIALTAAMEKVQNPKAKAALQKNIEKSYAKLALKIEKMKEIDKNKEDEAVEETISTTLLTADNSLTENTSEEENADAKDPVTTAEKEDEAVPVKQKRQEKAALKQEKKAAHEESKIQKALIKEKEKNAKKIKKQEMKENKVALKEVKKLEKENDKNKDKQKGNVQKEHRENKGKH